MWNSQNDAANKRLEQKASEVVTQFGPAIHQALAELNKTRLKNQGRLSSAEVGRRGVRWVLEWQAGEISYKMHIAIRIVDNGNSAAIDQVMVEKEASTPFLFEGHTPTTTMKIVRELNIDEIKKALEEMWPK